jgi:starch phosphorylase
MTVLRSGAPDGATGVSHLHGHIARRMWRRVWPGRDEGEVPIGHITNGVHVRSWLALSMNRIYDRYLGPDWPARQSDSAAWQQTAGIDEGELWETHGVLRRYLVEFVRSRAGQPSCLDPQALTIGFGRRFATYKRATLVLSDLDRLARLCGDAERPVQFVFAGKAHPRDDGGKQFIRHIVNTSRDPRFSGRLVFVENYDITWPALVQVDGQGYPCGDGSPGTSGQKVVLN